MLKKLSQGLNREGTCDLIKGSLIPESVNFIFC